MSNPAGVPDPNAKPSLILFDTGASETFAWEGSSTVGAAYVQIVDNSGTPIVSFGGGQEYTELDTTTSAKGKLILGRYSSTLPTLTNGEMNEPMLDSASILYMNNAYVLDSTNDSISVFQSTATNLKAQVSVASGGIVSGAIASGAIASGAIASGAAVSGAFADGSLVTLGAKTDAKSTATDGTSVTIMQVLKEISAMEQAPTSRPVTNTGTFAVQPTAAASGGYTPGKLISAASTNATSVKASAGTLGYITASNINASPRYLKIYNKASAPTVGTDTPVHTFLIPGNTSGAGTNIPLPPQGIALGTGIAFAITTGVADADTGAVAASDIVINYGYN